MKGKIENPNK